MPPLRLCLIGNIGSIAHFIVKIKIKILVSKIKYSDLTTTPKKIRVNNIIKGATC